MPTLAFFALAACFLLTVAQALTAQEATTSGTDTSATERSAFTAEELSHAWAAALERQDRSESYIRASDDDEVIVLEPYIVEGDDSLLMARIRRHLDQGPGSRRHRRFVLDPVVLQDLHLAQKYHHQFFHGPNPGTPDDRPMTPDLLGIAVGVFRAVLEKRTGDIFRTPAPGMTPGTTLSLWRGR